MARARKKSRRGANEAYESFRKRLSSISDEVLARIDRNLNDPNYDPGPVEWREDPDPLHQGWDWLEGDDELR